MAFKVEVKRIMVSFTKSTELRFVRSEPGRDICILILPALGVNARFYDRLMLGLAKAGYSAAVIDLQGQGSSSVMATRKENYGYLELLTEDIPCAVTETVALLNAKVTLLGHSLGGQIGSLYCGTLDERINGLILCTSGSVYFKCWNGKQRLKVLFGSQFARLYAMAVGYFPGKKFGFGSRTFQRLINDWGRQALTGKYKITGSNIDWEKRLAQVRLPVLALHLKNDFLAPPLAVMHLCKKLDAAIITKSCLDLSQLNHFTWVKHADPFVKEILDWMYQNSNFPIE